MKIDAFITTEVFGRNGKLCYKRKRRSKSFVKGFLAILLAQMRPSLSVPNIYNFGGVLFTLVDGAINFKAESEVGNSDYGVVVGTGDTAVVATDHSLETPIYHGVTSGKLSFSATTFGDLITSDPNVSFTLQRDFTNSSGASITVNEEGIYAYCDQSADSPTIFCLIRDVEDTGVEVEDGECLRVTYTLKTST